MKKLLFILLSFIALSASAQIPLAGTIGTIGPNDSYPTHLDTLTYGGFRSVFNKASLNAIPVPHRKLGMQVYVQSVDSVFSLRSGIANLNWVAISSGNPAGDFLKKLGNVNESFNGVKTANPTITPTGNNQTFDVFAISPVLNNPSSFTGTTFRVPINGNVAANMFNGLDGTVGLRAASGTVTIGAANRLRVLTGGSTPVFTLLDGGPGAPSGDTYLRTNRGSAKVSIGEYGRVEFGGNGPVLASLNAVAVDGLKIMSNPQPQHNADTVVGLRLTPNFGMGNAIDTYDNPNGGTGYTDGTYLNILCINGTGDFARANVTVSGGSVTAFTLTNGGAGYAINDIVSFSGIGAGGTTANFKVTGLKQYTGLVNRVIKSTSTEPSEFAGTIKVGTAPSTSTDVMRLGDMSNYATLNDNNSYTGTNNYGPVQYFNGGIGNITPDNWFISTTGANAYFRNVKLISDGAGTDQEGKINFNGGLTNFTLRYNPSFDGQPGRLKAYKNGEESSTHYLAYLDDLSGRPDSATLANTYLNKITGGKVIGATSFGDTTVFQAAFTDIGTSIGYAKGYGTATSLTDSYAFKTSRAIGLNLKNISQVGRITQTTDTVLIPRYLGDGLLMFEGIVNDAIRDTTVYTIPLFTAAVNLKIDNAIAKGWPANKIMVFIASFWSTTAFANHGDIAYRHSIYAAACASIASSRGIRYLDNYPNFQTQNTTLGGVLLSSDNLHPTPRGQDSIASALNTYLKTFITARPLTTTKLSVYQSEFIQGDINLNGNANLANVNVTNDIVLNSFEGQIKNQSGKTAASVILGGNFGLFGKSANTRKLGGVATPTYAGTGDDVYPLIYGDAMSTSNIVNIGGGNSSAVSSSASEINFWTSPFSTTGINRGRVFGTGNTQFGGTLSDNGNFWRWAGAATAGSSAISSSTTVTFTADNQNLYGLDIDGVTIAGTGLLNITITNAATSAADGTYTNQTITNISGAGSGATVTFVVSGGLVTSATVASGNRGSGYTNTTTFQSAAVPGATFSSGTTGYSGDTYSSIRGGRGPMLLPAFSDPANNIAGQLWNSTGSILKGYDGTVKYRVLRGTDVAGTTGQIPVYNSTGFVVPTSSLIATSGGTGQTVYAIGDLLYASSTSALSKRTIGTTGQVLTVSGGLPTWATTESYLRLTGSGTGAATTISIPHGITGVTSASIAIVTPINAASSGVSYVTTDATNINIVYSSAPVSGTNNLSFNVVIKP